MSILLLFYALLVRISVFFLPAEWEPTNMGFLSHTLYQWIDYNSTFANILSVLLIFVQATYLNHIISKYRMAKDISLFTGVFYILIASMIPDFLYLSPVLIANTFIILTIAEIFEVYKKYSSSINNYNIGLWIALASLFYFPYIFFLVVGWVGLSILRGFKTKDRIMIFLGFFTPYIILFSYIYSFDMADTFMQIHIYDSLSFFDYKGSANLFSYITTAIFLLFVTISILSVNIYNRRKNIQVQKNINVIYWAMVMGLFAILFQSNVTLEHLLVFVVPLGIFISFNFSSMPKQWAETCHIFLLGVVLIFQYRSLIGL